MNTDFERQITYTFILKQDEDEQQSGLEEHQPEPIESRTKVHADAHENEEIPKSKKPRVDIDIINEVRFVPQEHPAAKTTESTDNKPIKFSCPDCNFVTFYDEKLRKHMIAKKHSLDKVRKFQCKICSFTSYYDDKVTDHIIKVHVNGGLISFSFEPEGDLYNNTNKLPTYRCPKPFCTFETFYKNNLKVHIYSKHTLAQWKK